jgi:hypothetical protein
MSESFERDRELGAALLELEVPEHRVDFDRELRGLLALERRRRRRRRYLRWAVAPGLAAVAVVLVVLFGLPRTGSGPSSASAARMQAKVRTAFAEARALTGKLVFVVSPQGHPAQRSEQTFAIDSRGDLRIETPGSGTAVYGAATGVVRALERSASLGGGPLFASVTSGYPPSGPALGSDFTQRRLTGVVRSLLAAHDPRVEPVMVGGRAAWRVTLPVEPDPALFEADGIEVTVDQQTGVPLRVEWTAAGKARALMRLEQLRVDPSLPADEFELAFPRGEVLHQDLGYRRVSLARARALVRYDPFVPDELPDGFHRGEIAAARKVSAAAVDVQPAPRNAVELSFRRGLQQFVVGSQATGRGASDPLGGPHGKRVTLHGGVLDGTTAEVVIDPRAIPHLWVATSGLVVYVAGDLTRDELISVAESLRPRS